MRGKRSWSRRAGLVALVLVVLIAGAFALREPLLAGVGEAMVVDEPVHAADAILVLNGDAYRSVHAARLFARGLAPRLLIVSADPVPPELEGIEASQTAENVAVLERQGVPPRAIRIIEPDGPLATSTREEAEIFAKYARSHDIHRVILVTGLFHTRRARWTFRHALAGSGTVMEVSAAPDREYTPRNWWHYERGLISFFEEWVKWGYYLSGG